MALAHSWLLRNAACSIAVLVVVGGAAYGLPTADRRLPDRRPVPAGRPYRVGGGVTVEPPPGALLDLSPTRERPDGGSAVFVVGGLRYAVVVAAATVPAARVERRLATKLRTAGYRVDPGGVPVSTVDGHAGLTGRFERPGRAGRYAVFVLAGREVQVTVVGAPDLLDEAGPAVLQTMASVRGPA